MRLRPPILLLPLLFAGGLAVSAAVGEEVLLWPEQQRAFFQDGPGLLLDKAERERFAALGETAREDFIASFLARSPELEEGIRRRRQLVRQSQLSPLDVRAKLLFLNGQPSSRRVIECGLVYRPMEVWAYGAPEDPDHLIFYQLHPQEMYRLWLPLDSKRVLYTSEMEYFLDQWEELQRRISGRRFDYQICKEAKEVDRITGVSGLTGYLKDRPTNQDMLRFLEPPEDLEQWARSAAVTPLADPPEELPVESFDLRFPAVDGQRMVVRATVRLPEHAELGVSTEDEDPELDLSIEGTVEQGEGVFDTFRMRYRLEPPEEAAPLALVVERSLRPRSNFLLRLKVQDEVSGAASWIERGFAVPAEPDGSAVEPFGSPEELVFALGEQVALEPMAGQDGLVIVPPESDVVIGLWRAEVLVTGERIAKVVLLVDGRPQLTRTRPPFSAEVRLEPFPKEQVVRAEGYDAEGNLVLADEVTLNQPRGALRVRILEPRRGVEARGEVKARAEVVVPEERRVEQVQFLVDGQLVASLEKPPWESNITVPDGGDLSYLTVTAELDDGSRAEDVRFLNNPQYLEEVDVNLVELYVTVTDRSGGLVTGLAAEDFEVYEEGRRQQIEKFELVENLPLTLGLVLDTSGSMANSLYEAQKAAVGFLDAIVTRRDRCFAIGFADRPSLLMPPTNDVEAVAASLDSLLAAGFTSLHDALVHSLYYFRGVRGRKALVLLSDGDDTSSNLSFDQALEYARYSGVVIYTIGLNVGFVDQGIRNKLRNLASETGGESFFISKAEELAEVYEAIERELRSQYLVAYDSDREGEEATYRAVEVKMKQRGLKARTARGYYE